MLGCSHLIWRIQLGVLRREVDGQGLTEQVWLTPLGREVLERWSDDIPAPGHPAAQERSSTKPLATDWFMSNLPEATYHSSR